MLLFYNLKKIELLGWILEFSTNKISWQQTYSTLTGATQAWTNILGGRCFIATASLAAGTLLQRSPWLALSLHNSSSGPDFPNHWPDGAARQFKHLIWSNPSSDNMMVWLQLAWHSAAWSAPVMDWSQGNERIAVLCSPDRICSPLSDHGTGGAWERMKKLPCIAGIRDHSTGIPIEQQPWARKT